MKICLINNTYPPYERGGSDRITSIIADEAGRSGKSCFIIALRPCFSKLPLDFKPETRTYYLPSLFPHLRHIPKPVRFVWHLADLFNIGKLIKIFFILRKEKPDIVITNNIKGLGGLLPIAIKRAKAKHCHILHDIQLIHPSGLMIFGQEGKINTFFTKAYSAINIRIFKEVDLAVAPSTWLMNMHKERGFFTKAKTAVRFNPLAVSPRGSQREKSGQFDFAIVGEITKEKGLEVILEAVKKPGLLYPRARFHFIGKGADQARLETAKKNGNIVFHGFLPNQEAKIILGKCHCLILPSLCYENSPTVLFEAISAGLPFICSGLGGNIEIADKFGGIEFEPGNARDLSEKIELMMANYSNFEQKASENIKKLQSWDAASYLNFILGKLV